MSNIKILLDLDGVVRDWCQGVREKFNMDFNPTYYGEIEDILKRDGLSVSEFWEAQDRDFWLGLKMYPWANELIEFLESVSNNVCILTAPTLNNAGYNQEWIKINLPKFFNSKKYLIGPAKYYCADKYSILIDDKTENITQFIEYGGYGLLFPQYWNANAKIIENHYPLHFVKEYIIYFKEAMNSAADSK